MDLTLETFENVLAYMLGQHTIEENNKQTLEQLQFRNGSVLKVNLKLKGGLWEYHYNQIFLNIFCLSGVLKQIQKLWFINIYN